MPGGHICPVCGKSYRYRTCFDTHIAKKHQMRVQKKVVPIDQAYCDVKEEATVEVEDRHSARDDDYDPELMEEGEVRHLHIRTAKDEDDDNEDRPEDHEDHEDSDDEFSDFQGRSPLCLRPILKKYSVHLHFD